MSSLSASGRERILAIGDSYMSVNVFANAFDGDDRIAADIEFRSIDAARQGSGAWATSQVHESEGSPQQIDKWLDGHSILIVHGAPVTRELLERNPSVRFVACARGGPANVDLEAAEELGVKVTTTPGKNAPAVADLTIGFLVDLWRNLGDARRYVSHTASHGLPLAESTFEGARWFGRELSGARLGLVGLGHVATLVAHRARALGLDVVAFDPFVPYDSAPTVRRANTLDELLDVSDALSLHARATSENRHMIGERELSRLADDAILINTARESLVDEHALLNTLRAGRLRGVAMDVCEPDGPWRELVADPRVVLTPHIGGATHETLDRGARMLREEVDRYLRGEPLRWSVSA